MTPIDYADGDLALTGHLIEGPAKGLLLVHGGGGKDAHTFGQAERYAALGLTVFALDMFGSGDPRETFTAIRADLGVVRTRALAGLQILKDHLGADAPVAAVGFCFGGMTVLELARAGTDLRGVISMHGALKTTLPAEAGVVRAKVLACHGALDPHVPLTDVVAFIEEMDAAGADAQLVSYSGAVHGFTHSDAVEGAYPGVAYHQPTDERSFALAVSFLTEVLA